MPDIEINVQDYQNVFSASVGSSPLIQVSIDHSFNTVSVDVVTQNPTVNVDIIGTGPQGPKGDTGDTGATGADGADGVSPEVTIASITGGHSVTITDADHPGGQTFNVMDGADGQNGADGAAAGFGTPTASVDANVGTPAVTVTASGPDTAKVFDFAFSNLKGDKGDTGSTGSTGPAGPGVPTGGSTGQVLAKKTGTNYDTEWVTPSVGSSDIYWCTYGSTTSAQIETALAADQLPCVVRDDVVYVYAFKTSATKHYFGSTGLKTQQYLYLVEDNGTWAHNYIDIRSIPSGGNAGQLLAKNSATDYDVHWVNKTQDYPSAYCTTAAATATKKASCSLWVATANSYLHVLIGQANTNAGAITLDVNSTGAKPVYINGAASSATNYTLPAGSYIVFYDGTNFHFRTDGKLPADISGSAGSAEVIPWGKVDNTSTATAYTATIPGITKLVDGTSFWLKNGVITSASGFTVNINNLGAKKCYNNMTAATQDTTIFNSNYTMLFVYDSSLDSGAGGYYIYRGYDANTNTIGYQIRTNSFSVPMTSITYRYRLLFQSADKKRWVPANNSTSTNATAARSVCQDPINPFGPIVYYGTTASVAAGSRPSAAYLWQEYTLTLGYSFQKSPNYELTAWKPVYLKCAPQADGSAIIDSTTPFTQDLPTTEDGKLYILLGFAYSTTSIELVYYHPVYWYKGGRIRPFTDAATPTPAEIGAIALPAAPSAGDFLVYNGSSWAAVTMAEWQGGAY